MVDVHPFQVFVSYQKKLNFVFPEGKRGVNCALMASVSGTNQMERILHQYIETSNDMEMLLEIHFSPCQKRFQTHRGAPKGSVQPEVLSGIIWLDFASRCAPPEPLL